MRISADQVRHAARLARLELNEDEIRRMTGELDQILAYIDKLNELDTAGVVPTSHAVARDNALREDVVVPSLDREAALANAPLHNGEAFVVPRVI